jgi:hypothetical protein
MSVRPFHKRTEKGQSMVELAIGIIILLILLAGIVDMGRMLFFYISLRDATQEGAVYGSVGAGTAGFCQITKDRVLARLGNPTNVTVNVYVDSIACTSSTISCSGHEVKVSVTAPFSFTMPLMGGRTINLISEITDTILNPCP